MRARVCLVSQEFPPETGHGGIATQTLRKARALARHGAEVHVISHAVDGASTHTRDGMTVHRICGPDSENEVRSEAFRWLAWSIRVERALEELFRDAPLDLVEFADYGAEGYAYLINRPEGPRPAVVVHAQGPLAMLAQTVGWPSADDPLLSVGLHMEGEMLRRADAVYASSACGAGWLATAHGVVSRANLHTGIDLGLFRPESRRTSRSPLVVLYVGRVSESKGVLDLVAATANVAGQGHEIVLRLVGRCDERTRTLIEDAARPAGLDVELPGPVAHDQLPAVYRGADMFASPSHYEAGPGFTFLEAMASGLPVIGPLGSGIEETVGGAGNGLLVSPGDREGLAGALLALVEDARLRADLGRRARQRAEEFADERHCGAAIAAFFEQVLAEHAGAA